MQDKKVILPPNELKDGSTLEEKIKKVEKENEKKQKENTAVERAKKAKKETNKAIIKNAHHLLFLLYSSCSSLGALYFSGMTVKSISIGCVLYIVSFLAYLLQLFLHELVIKSEGDLTKLSQMFREKTQFARRG